MASHILLLEEEPAVRELVKRVLEDAGYRVDTLTDPLAAVAEIQEGRHDLVITNGLMQGPAGAQLLARLRLLWPELPILHLDDQSHPRTPEYPSDAPSLAKPFHHDVLLDTVRGLLNH